jgi:hypothetical protein
VQIDHGGLDARVAHEGLDSSDVGSGLEGVGVEGMPEGVASTCSHEHFNAILPIGRVDSCSLSPSFEDVRIRIRAMVTLSMTGLRVNYQRHHEITKRRENSRGGMAALLRFFTA